MGNYGLKITRDGYDVNTTEPRNYVFSSKYGSVKIYAEPSNKTYQTIDVNNGSNATISVTHSLGFIPLVLFFIELKPGSGHWYMGGHPVADPTDSSGAVVVSSSTYTYVDDTYIKVRLENTTGSNLTVKYYYFIFADNG